jgi:chromate transporter
MLADRSAKLSSLTGADELDQLGRPAYPTFGQAVRVWTRVAALSFGGPAGQIAVMHRILVEERFLHALNFCMLLPGPEAQQLAVYIGWLLHRTMGGLVAGTLFVVPGAVAIMALSWIYAAFGNVGVVQALFFGLKAAVLAVVLEAVVRIGRRALRNDVMRLIAAVAFLAIFAFKLPFPLIVLGAGLVGFAGGRLGLPAFMAGSGHARIGDLQIDDAESALGEDLPAHARPSLRWTATVGTVLLVLWLAPLLLLWASLGPDNVFVVIAGFFAKMAVVTFGGAYAVLAYVAQAAVDTYGWLRPGEMLDGLGMAETTPGPLIMVTQFVGFMGAYRDSGALSPMLAGTLGGLLTTWVTFVPCFLWIFVGAPYVERLRGNRGLAAALTAITAAVVGVILNLAVWFALHVLFGEQQVWQHLGITLELPVLASLNLPAAVLTLAAILAVFWVRLGMLTTLGLCSMAGIVWHLIAD